MYDICISETSSQDESDDGVMDPPRSALLIINVISLGMETMSSDTPDLCPFLKLTALFALKDCFKF